MEKQKNEEIFVYSKEGYKVFKLFFRDDKELVAEIKGNSRNEKIPKYIYIPAVNVIDQITARMNFAERMAAYNILSERVKESQG